MSRHFVMGYVLLVIALVLNASANILLKLGSARLHELKDLPLAEVAMRLLVNYHLLLGLTFFALNVVFYASALNRLNLSIAYPIMMAGGVVIITLFSTLYLKEALNMAQYVGISLITVGILLVTTQGTSV